MSAITAKTEFAFDAPASYAQPRPLDYTPRTIATHHARAARGGVGAILVAAVRWMVEQPRRRAVISELELLSDHELADIGLSRGDLHRVFDRDYAAGRAA